MATVASGGHGIYYIKPVWAEIKGQTLLKRENVPYGGKADESYRVEKVLTGKDAIYLLGFRAQEQRSSGSGDKPPTPVISHYAEYDMNKKTLVRVQNVYENTPRYELGVTNEHINYFYGTVSADNRDDGNTVVVFSWIRDRFIYTGNAGIEDDVVQSQIYYAQCGKGKFNGVEKIGEGFIPLVKVDSLGNVHVIWVNNNGSLVHRAKKDGKWGDEEFFLNGVDNSKTKRFGKYICAEFDKDNNLNVVFLSNEQFVYAKIRAD